jgi:hypothetical protein
MSGTHLPRTTWGREVAALDDRVATLHRMIGALEAERRNWLRKRCLHRDSGGARCTADVDHVIKGEERHHWDPLTDWPEPVDLRVGYFGNTGIRWCEADRWDLGEDLT